MKLATISEHLHLALGIQLRPANPVFNGKYRRPAPLAHLKLLFGCPLLPRADAHRNPANDRVADVAAGRSQAFERLLRGRSMSSRAGRLEWSGSRLNAVITASEKNEMDYYVGLDVSLRSVAVCVIAAGGRTVLERSVHCEIDDIVHCLFGFPVPGFRVGFDAGAMSQHRLFGLQVAGFDVGSIEAR